MKLTLWTPTEQQTSRHFQKWDSWSGCIWTVAQVLLWYLEAFPFSYNPQTHLHFMVLGSQAGKCVLCVSVCIHLPSLRRKTRIRGGGEREEALSLSVRLFLTAAISLIRLWRNRNLAIHRPNLPLPLSLYILLTHSPHPPSPSCSVPLPLSHLPFSLCPSLFLCCPSVSILMPLSHLLLMIQMEESSRCKWEAKWRSE